MICCDDDLTLDDVLSDPLIRTVMDADGIDGRDFAALLEDVARQREESLAEAA